MRATGHSTGRGHPDGDGTTDYFGSAPPRSDTHHGTEHNAQAIERITQIGRSQGLQSATEVRIKIGHDRA
jgi:hypothetical protein